MANLMTSQNEKPHNVITLVNGESLDPGEFDRMLLFNCHYIRHVVVTGEDQPWPLALVFPDSELFSNPDYKVTPMEGCFCPRNINELGRCLTGCMRLVNDEMPQAPDRIQRAVIIDDPSIFSNEGLLLSEEEIVKKYTRLISDIYNGKRGFGEKIIYVNARPNGLGC